MSTPLTTPVPVVFSTRELDHCTKLRFEALKQSIGGAQRPALLLDQQAPRSGAKREGERYCRSGSHLCIRPPQKFGSGQAVFARHGADGVFSSSKHRPSWARCGNRSWKGDAWELFNGVRRG